MKLLLNMVASLCLLGCVPLIHSYYKPEYPGAKYFGESCLGGAGAPLVAYFPYQGIFLSVAVAVEPNTVIMGFHIPEGYRLQILERNVTVTYERQDVIKEQLTPTDLRGGNPDPWEFRAIPSTIGKEDYFGELKGETKAVTFVIGADTTAYKTYLFKVIFDETKADAGTVEFPEIKINNKAYKGPVVPFKKSADFELSPINC